MRWPPVWWGNLRSWFGRRAMDKHERIRIDRIKQAQFIAEQQRAIMSAPMEFVVPSMSVPSRSLCPGDSLTVTWTCNTVYGDVNFKMTMARETLTRFNITTEAVTVAAAAKVASPPPKPPPSPEDPEVQKALTKRKSLSKWKS